MERVWYSKGFGRTVGAVCRTTVGGNNSVVECDLAKVEVAGSNPVSRSNLDRRGPLHPAWRESLRGQKRRFALRAPVRSLEPLQRCHHYEVPSKAATRLANPLSTPLDSGLIL